MSNVNWLQTAIWNEVLKETKKSILIKCPDTCKYRKHIFWYPKKLVNKIANSTDSLYLTYFEEMEISLQNQNSKENQIVSAKELFEQIKINRHNKA